MARSFTQSKPSTKILTVGVFDSGVGGLTVAAAIVKHIPWVKVIYFGDSARVPYGNKSRANIITYSEECVDFLIRKGADLVVIACNTSSAVAIDHLRKKFQQLPIIGVIDPGVISAITALYIGNGGNSSNTKASSKARSVMPKPNSNLKPNLNLKGITVAATYRTVSSHIYRSKIQSCKPRIPVYEVSCPLLVPIIEEGMKNKSVLEPVLKKYLQTVADKSAVLLLGCTHYPLIRNVFKKTFPQTIIVDSAETTAYYLGMLLRAGKISLTSSSKANSQEPYTANLSHLKGLQKLPLAKMVFNSPIKTSPVTKTQSVKISSKSLVDIYTNDLNEVFVSIAKKLFPQISVQVGKLK